MRRRSSWRRALHEGDAGRHGKATCIDTGNEGRALATALAVGFASACAAFSGVHCRCSSRGGETLYHLHFSILPPIPRPRSRLRRRHLHGLEPHILHRMPYSILDITPSPSPTPSDRQQPCLHNHRPSPRPYSVPGSTQTWPSHRPFFIPPDSPHPHFPSSGCGRFPNRYQSSPQPFASACKSSALCDLEAGPRAEVIPILPQTRPDVLSSLFRVGRASRAATPCPILEITREG